MTYSRDFRSKVIDTREKENLSMAEAAKRFGAGLISVLRWSKNIESITKRNKPATKIDVEKYKEQNHQLVFIDDLLTTCHVHMDMLLKVGRITYMGQMRTRNEKFRMLNFSIIRLFLIHHDYCNFLTLFS